MNNATRKRCLVHVYQLQISISHRQAGRRMACPLHRTLTSPHAYGGALYSVTCSQRKYHYRSMQSWPAALPKLLCGVGVYRKRTHRPARTWASCPVALFSCICKTLSQGITYGSLVMSYTVVIAMSSRSIAYCLISSSTYFPIPCT